MLRIACSLTPKRRIERTTDKNRPQRGQSINSDTSLAAGQWNLHHVQGPSIMGRRFKEVLAKNELCRVFQCGRIGTPPVIDLYGFAGGFDGFWFDQEHCGLTYKELEVAALAARANGFDSIVRMAPAGYQVVTQAYEAGHGGVMAA